MGIRTSSEQPENQVASAERVRPLRTVAAAGKQLSIQAENNQYFDGVTPPPTDKSGRGGKGKRQKMSKLSPGSGFITLMTHNPGVGGLARDIDASVVTTRGVEVMKVVAIYSNDT
ncbi:hypothetical protein J6590_030317 [Homalodisca vitripennis]|nr:hypothetical protein J6590_030317 [Homalodisca vitripennis]